MIENVTGKTLDLYVGVRTDDPWMAEKWDDVVAASQADFREIERRRATGGRCPCHNKTEAEMAMPYALFAFALPLLAIVGALIGWALR
jgi:hypothetical protein